MGQLRVAGATFGGMRGTSSPGASVNGVEGHLLPIDCSMFCAGQQHMKICRDLSNGKKIVFNVKNPLSDGMDLHYNKEAERSDPRRMRAGRARI